MQDAELVTSALNGDTLAYGELMEFLHRKVEKFAFQCGVNVEDINDVTQEVFFDLYKSLGEFESTYFTTRLYVLILFLLLEMYQVRQLNSMLKIKKQGGEFCVTSYHSQNQIASNKRTAVATRAKQS